jgi:hypothetical protein
MAKNSIKMSVHDVIEVSLESEELPFEQLKKETMELFKFAKNNSLITKPGNHEVA